MTCNGAAIRFTWPWLAGLVLLTLVPLAASLLLSFTRWDGFSERDIEWVGLQHILTDCRDHKCNRILLYKLDRLSRNTEATLALFRELTELGVEVVCVSQGITFDKSPMGKFTMTIFAAVAELESSHISERVLAGQSVARANGQKSGGSKPSKAKRLRLQRKIDAGKSVATCAAELGIARSSVYGMMERMSA